MKLTHYDRTLIHGLALLSRPPLIPDPARHKMVAEIVTIAADRATDQGEIAHLVRIAGQIGMTPEAHHRVFHNVASVMNEFDRVALGAHWDAARGAA